MSDQGQQIDPSRMISGRLSMTNNTKQARQTTHMPKRERGKGRLGDCVKSS